MNTPSPRRHAKISDLPGWPCPPRVEAIAGQPGSWGWIPVLSTHSGDDHVLTHDEEGYLWVKAGAVPKFRHLDENHYSPGGIVFHVDGGIGLWVHPTSYRYLGSSSRVTMQNGPDGPDAWIPVNEVVEHLPAFVEQARPVE